VKAKAKTPEEARAAAQRRALNALRRARRLAERNQTELSEWEGEFLGSVESRVETFGRAFGDPAKGEAAQALSTLQGVKLREIVKKARKSASGPIEEIEAEPLDDEEPG